MSIPPDRLVAALAAALMTAASSALPAVAQVPVEDEVRQIVSFTLQPGAAAEVRGIYRDELLDLYRADPAMRSLRVFREHESATPVDLVVVRAFDGMDGMDASNDALGELASSGRSVGASYGRISDRATGHTDEFIRMIPRLGHGDPSSMRYTAFVRYRVVPGTLSRFIEGVEEMVLPLERSGWWPSATGMYLLGDGWDVMRIIGFDSLGDYEAWLRQTTSPGPAGWMDEVVDLRSDQILGSIPGFVVR